MNSQNEQPPVQNVLLNGLALSKLVESTHKNLPKTTFGILTGFRNDTTYLVTNFFTLPDFSQSSYQDEEEEEFLKDVSSFLKESNFEYEILGWTVNSSFGNFYNKSVVQKHMNWQKKIEKPILLVYDPIISLVSELSVKAFVISQKYYNLYKKSETNRKIQYHSKQNINEVFLNIPINYNLTLLSRNFLKTLTPKEIFAKGETKRSVDGFLIKSFETMRQSLDSIVIGQNKAQNFINRNIKKLRYENNNELPKKVREIEKITTNYSLNYKIQSIFTKNRLKELSSNLENYSNSPLLDSFLSLSHKSNKN
ncbi:eukaryotic translation initiation factor 3 subunit h [Anaeramoeba flamelloides]|uniref:Eukaryotic translation initiation factor 3 subunit h n=1 Tax=Anaeramoeba flamelloides TaxID=1746091 RepID=A0AAV7YAK9_9EUKA|nr:eukaryotic translation initiation factor 3 subunit h [Anaeramoeba flamelloides]KAJ6236881.1 eukaryotic translation initiation factor 3 subunit h [Anaeramoeba flamelloides]